MRAQKLRSKDRKRARQCRPRIQDDDHSTQPGPSTESCRPQRYGILPARYRDDLSDDDDGVICELCSFKESLGMAGDTVFWVTVSFTSEPSFPLDHIGGDPFHFITLVVILSNQKKSV